MKTKILLATIAAALTVLVTDSLLASEPTPSPARGPTRDAAVLLNETELRVPTQQYERTLTQFYDAQMALSLLENSADEQAVAEVQAAAMSKRIKLLAEW